MFLLDLDMASNINKEIIRHRKRKQPWAFPKNAASAENAKTKKVYVVAANSTWALLNSTFDNRTRVGKVYQKRIAALEEELDSPPTATQRTLIEQAVRLSLMADLGWAECMKSGILTPDNNEAPASISYIRVSREMRTVLATLFPEEITLPEERVRVIFELPAALPAEIYAKVIEHESTTDN